VKHTVLILTDETDGTADRVADELTLRGVPVVILDAAEFPGKLSMTATISGAQPWSGRLSRTGETALDLAQVGAVYYRRPTQFVMDERMSGPERTFAYAEARYGFGGVLNALGAGSRPCLWVNSPVPAAHASYKPVQLAAATAVGLTIPETIITSDPQAAHAWATELGRPIIYKPLGGIWHADEGQVRALYTSHVEDPAELLDPNLSLTAHLFQESVPKQFEARAIVVGSQVFAVRIDAGSEAARQDWRADYPALSYAELELPSELSAALVELHARLDLVYGAVDLIHDTSGRWVFLETNPAGEWGWLAREVGIPVAAALAEVMEKGLEWRR
jgi:ATP-grasp ribosomal peptide maturase